MKQLSAALELSDEVWAQFLDEMEEFNFGQDELLSIIVNAAVLGLVQEGDRGCLYERINWVEIKRRGLCE